MSDDIDIDSILDSVISRSATRKKVAIEEAIRNQGKEKMAQTVQRLIREAQANLRATLSAELGKIASDTEKKLETVRQESQQQKNVDKAEKKHHSTSDEKNFMSELLRDSVDILKQYHILQEEFDDIEHSEHNLSATLEPGSWDDAPTGVLELMQHNMGLPSSAEQEIIQPMRPLADAADNSNKLGANTESDDDKGWLRDNDEGDQNGTISQEGSAVIRRYEVQRGDLGWGRSSEHTIKSTPRNSQRRSSRRIILDSDEEDEKQNSTLSSKSRKPTGDIHEKLPPRRPLQYLFPRHTLQDRRRYSQAPLSSSLPTRGRKRSKSPVNLKKAANLIEGIDPYRRRSPICSPASQPASVSKESITASQQSLGRRRQPIRKSTVVPYTYNVKEIFKNQVGSLYSPGYRLIKSE